METPTADNTYTVDFLIEHDQDALYETRDYLREILSHGKGADIHRVATWMAEQFADSWRTFDFAQGITETDWFALAQSCLEDTEEIVEYERKHEQNEGDAS